MQYKFIAIEGNIGAGKTTLATMLQQHYRARLMLEAFAENPFLSKFYDDPKQYAFPLELFFLAERYKQYKETFASSDIFSTATISDYLFHKCLLFARINLPEEEYALYQRFFEIIQRQIIQPDLLIYLHVPVQQLKENIRNRNRSYEQKIQDTYLMNIQEVYLQYIKQQEIKTLMIDVGKADFVNAPEHLQAIIHALDHEYEAGLHSILLPE
jgi:deoxyadenosine/deoxycytidine kinase